MRERNEKPAKGAGRGEGPDVLALSAHLALSPQELEHVGQGVQIPAMLDLLGDNVLSGGTSYGASEIRQQEVVDRPFPTAHPSADCLLLNVLREGSALLCVFGVEGGGQVALGVESALISLEENLFGGIALAGSRTGYILLL